MVDSGRAFRRRETSASYSSRSAAPTGPNKASVGSVFVAFGVVLAVRVPARQPLDLNRIVPIPPAIVRAGCVPDGRAWMRDNWGCEAPLGRVDLQVQQRIRRNRGRPSPKNKGSWSITTASYRWWSDGTPTAALRRLVVRWPTLDFRLTIDGRPKRLTEATGHAKRCAV